MRQFEEVLGHFDDLVLSYRIQARKPRLEFFAACQARVRPRLPLCGLFSVE